MNKGLDKSKPLVRIPIQMAEHLKANQYKFLDYLLYRTNLKKYQIHISTMMKELRMSKPTVIGLCKEYLALGILEQNEAKDFYHRTYKLNYIECESYIYQVIRKKDGKETLPVEPVKDGKETLPVEPVKDGKDFSRDGKDISKDGQIPDKDGKDISKDGQIPDKDGKETLTKDGKEN